MRGKAKTRAAAPLRVCVDPPKVPAAQRLPVPPKIAAVDDVLWEMPRGGGVLTLPVYFMDNPDAETRRKILAAANRWYDKGVGARFAETSDRSTPVRVARTRGQGYYAYLGDSCRQIPLNMPTVNLDSFTAATSDAEYLRVVCHEFGHVLGCPHEHMRRELVERIDPAKAYAFFGGPPNNWSRQTVNQQVLTPLSTAGLRATPQAYEDSVMAYSLPGSITKDGRPIRGGSDITAVDAAFMATVYPGKPAPPVSPPPPPPVSGAWTYTVDRATGAVAKVG